MKSDYNWEREALHSRLKIKDLETQLEIAHAFHKVAVLERDEARENYQFMVNRAAAQHLDGYRELGAKCAELESSRDFWKARAEALSWQIDNEGCAASHKGETTYNCDATKPCGLCRLRNKQKNNGR